MEAKPIENLVVVSVILLLFGGFLTASGIQGSSVGEGGTALLVTLNFLEIASALLVVVLLVQIYRVLDTINQNLKELK